MGEKPTSSLVLKIRGSEVDDVFNSFRGDIFSFTGHAKTALPNVHFRWRGTAPVAGMDGSEYQPDHGLIQIPYRIKYYPEPNVIFECAVSQTMESVTSKVARCIAASQGLVRTGCIIKVHLGGGAIPNFTLEKIEVRILGWTRTGDIISREGVDDSGEGPGGGEDQSSGGDSLSTESDDDSTEDGHGQSGKGDERCAGPEGGDTQSGESDSNDTTASGDGQRQSSSGDGNNSEGQGDGDGEPEDESDEVIVSFFASNGRVPAAVVIADDPIVLTQAKVDLLAKGEGLKNKRFHDFLCWRVLMRTTCQKQNKEANCEESVMRMDLVELWNSIKQLVAIENVRPVSSTLRTIFSLSVFPSAK